MPRRSAITWWIGAGLVAIGLAALIPPANAQGPIERLFDRLRGEPEAPPAPVVAPAGPARVIAAPAPAAEKAEDAQTLLVVGDFQARGLANALEDVFADQPGIIVIDRSNGSSGIVRDDFYDWSTVLPDLIEELEPTYVVVMIGVNDRQEIRSDGGRFGLRSEGWDAAYAARVAELADSLAIFGDQAIWVGHPPMRQRSMSADMAFFNSVYAAAAENAGIKYLDIWDAFADEEGRFTATGPGVDGQSRVLRADDGFSLTSAGRAKLAFFVENEIDLGDEGEFVLVPDPGGIEIQEDGIPRVVGPVLVLGDPPPGAGGELVSVAPAMRPSTTLYRFFVRGEALPPVAGRVDDFAWPPAAAAEEPVADAAEEEGQAALAEPEDGEAAAGL